IKICSTAQADKLVSEHLYFRIVGNHGLLASNRHHIFHGFTPLSSRHRRTEATAPLPQLGEGCGRCMTLIWPNKTIATREPSRSVISAPNSMNSATVQPI